MRQTADNKLTLACLLLDAGIMFMAGWLAYSLSFSTLILGEPFLLLIAATIFLSLLFSLLGNLYQSLDSRGSGFFVRRLVLSWGLAFCLLATALITLGKLYSSWIWLLLFMSLSLVGGIVYRLGVIQYRKQRQPSNFQQEFVGGEGDAIKTNKLRIKAPNGGALVAKAIEDYLLSICILLMVAPLMLVIAIAIRLTSGSPVIFRQMRGGINGCKIKVYKFRTLVPNQEPKTELTQATKNDIRVTPLGAWLRHYSLDELPQFINVLQGKMSIVGPRPHALEHQKHYQKLVASYMLRYQVKPGITGWAQIHGYRGETDSIDKIQKRLEHDLWYIENWSLWLDFKIILLSLFKGFSGPHAY